MNHHERDAMLLVIICCLIPIIWYLALRKKWSDHWWAQLAWFMNAGVVIGLAVGAIFIIYEEIVVEHLLR